MEFGLLGQLLVRDSETVTTIASARQRILLALLLLRAGTIVQVEELVDAVWDGAPPPRARATLYTYANRLRSALGPYAGARVQTRSPGYLIEVHGEELDLHRFTRLCREGQALAETGAWQESADRLHEALRLWRGQPLLDIPSPRLQSAERGHLEETRLQALQLRIDMDLRLGRHHQLVSELGRLVAAYPLREYFHAQRMVALYRSDRQAEALAAYRDVRETLIRELGIEPGHTLRGLHRQILADDPELGPPGWPPG